MEMVWLQNSPPTTMLVMVIVWNLPNRLQKPASFSCIWSSIFVSRKIPLYMEEMMRRITTSSMEVSPPPFRSVPSALSGWS